MSVISGVISIKDNATATIKAIKKEQSSFKKEVQSTKKELLKTWEKKYTHKVDTSAATKKVSSITKKLEPLRKKLVTAVAVKDIASDKIKAVSSKLKAIGKKVFTPVVNIAVKGKEALSAVGKGIGKFGKAAAIGIGAVVAAGGIALGAMFSGSTEEAFAAMESAAKLQQVMSNTMAASAADVGSVMDLVNKQELSGVIEGDVQVEGLQELGTYLTEKESMEALLPVMNDMLAQQYGINATQENAVNIATMMGKVMNGQTSALSRLGYSFTSAQEKILKYGTEEERAATLAEVIQESVGGMNQALAETDIGRIKQAEKAFGQLKEQVGNTLIGIKGKLAGIVMQNMPAIQGLATSLTDTLGKAAEGLMPIISKAVGKILPVVEKVLPVIGDLAMQVIPLIDGVFSALDGDTSGPLGSIGALITGFKQMLPALRQVGGGIMTTLSSVMTALTPVVTSIMSAVQGVLPVISTVVSTIGNVLVQAAPLVSFLVDSIGQAISTLAPVFNTIFGGIASKVGSVISFVSSKMGFLQEVFNTVFPIIADIFNTAWNIIGPVIDIAIGAFKVIFNVVQAVFPAVKAIIETAWNFIKPIAEGIGKVLGGIGQGIGWLAEKLGFGGDDGEALDSSEWSDLGGTATSEVADPASNQVSPAASSQVPPPATGTTPVEVVIDPEDWPDGLPSPGDDDWGDGYDMPPPTSGGPSTGNSGLGGTTSTVPVEQNIEYKIEVTVAKLADAVTIKEEADIDELSETVGTRIADKIAVAMKNNQPAPATT